MPREKVLAASRQSVFAELYFLIHNPERLPIGELTPKNPR